MKSGLAPYCTIGQATSGAPHHRFVIALHSPVRVTETGLRLCPPEKGRQIGAIRSRALRSLQSTLRTQYYEIRACFAYFAAKGGAVSLQFRLAGGEGGILKSVLIPKKLHANSLKGKRTELSGFLPYSFDNDLRGLERIEILVTV